MNDELQYLKLFKDVCKKVNASLDSRDVLHAIAENAVRMLHAKGCAIYLLDPNQRELRVVASCGLSEAYLGKGPMDADRSIADCISGEEVLVDDATTDPRIQYHEEAKVEGIASILSVPMALQRGVIGVLRIYTAEPRRYTPVEREFISGLAEIGSIAIENARMHSRLRDDYETLVIDVHEWFEYGGRV